MSKKRAVVLLSGGMDSAVTLYLALRQGFECLCLSFDYGQRHSRETVAAGKLAKAAGCFLRRVKLRLSDKGSVLMRKNASLTRGLRKNGSAIPETYVPARNIVFLSCALSIAEAEGAGDIFIGAHDQDYSGYPDCRPEFFAAFQAAADLGTKAGCEGRPVRFNAPLLGMSKKDIVLLGAGLGVPFELTRSCYKGEPKPCGKCESCLYRAKGFAEAGIADGAARKSTVHGRSLVSQL
ncbi:MAG: 7-cyano-7-deazaguanine synthase QueC [Candidatus Omnitrophota bacterium]|jgi:7-cyano-7-deazaguanine synthase